MQNFSSENSFMRRLMESDFALDVTALVSAAAVIIGGIVLYMVTRQAFEAALKRTHMQPSLVKIAVRSLYKWLLIILTTIFALSQLGFNVTAALAGVGVLGIAIGFAAQQTLANILSGFGIFIDHLYRSGDWVKIDGHYGEIVNITLRATKIRTLDNTYVIIPNSVVSDSSVINYSEQGRVRIAAKVAVPYECNVEDARRALVATVSQMDGIRSDTEPEVVVEELGDSGVNLLVRVWIDNAREEQKYFFRLTELCKKALDDAGITIPFPQRDVHMKKE
jgi:small-conductance mechanosensitive channel